MNKWIAGSGVLSLFTLGIHVVMGGQEVHDPTLRSELALLIKAVWSVVWHFTTAILGLNGLALIYAAKSEAVQKPLVLLVVAQYAALSILFIGYSMAYLGSPIEMPQWTLFAAICALGLWGLRHSVRIAGAEGAR